MPDTFLSPYGTLKVLEGVIPANQTVRPNWLQTFFGRTRTSEAKTVNFDVEFSVKNVMGANVAPDADVEIVDPVGEFFDPNHHQAVGADDSEEFESGQIIETLQKGYQSGDVLLRSAMVRVAK